MPNAWRSNGSWVALTFLAALGCGDSGSDNAAADAAPDAAALPDAAAGDTSGTGADGPEIGSNLPPPGPDVAMPTPDAGVDSGTEPDLGGTEDASRMDGGPPLVDAFPPGADAAAVVPNPAAKKLLPARSSLLGLHRSGCSYGDGTEATGQRWCAISRPGQTLGRVELWVLDIKAAIAGSVPCDGTNPACIKLSDDLFSATPQTGGPVYPTSHRFYGDTLIYYANAVSGPTELYQGPVFAWKPGWPAPRQIGPQNSVLCTGHSRADVAVCIVNISPDNAPVVTWDLHAGTTSGILPKVATIHPVHPTTMSTQWRSGFTQDGLFFAYSTGGPTFADRETLYVIPTAMLGTGTPTMIGPGISRWTLSGDGTRWFYLKDFNYNVDGEPSGTLYMRDFAGGTAAPAETPIASTLVKGGSTGGVGAFQPIVDQMNQDAGIGVLQNIVAARGDYLIINNPAGNLDDPTNVRTIVTDIGGMPIYSQDLRYSYYNKSFDQDIGTADSHVVNNTTGVSCALTTSLQSSIFGQPFTASAGLVFWVDNFNQATQAANGWLASPSDCMTARRQFATAADFWFINGDDRLVYSDQSDGVVVTLRHAPILGGIDLGPPVEIQRGVGRLFGILPDFSGVLFTLATGNPEVDGVYHSTLPP